MKSGFSIQQVKIVEKDKMDEIKEAIYKIEEDLDSDDSDLEKETKVLKERTKHSIRLMKNEFMKKVQFPYLVRALPWVQIRNTTFTGILPVNRSHPLDDPSYPCTRYTSKWPKTAVTEKLSGDLISI